MANKFMLVRTPDKVGMGGASCTELFCTILKNGTLSLRTCRDQYGDGGRCWVKGKRGIQTPEQFVEALEHMEDISQHFTHDEVLEVLYSKLPIFSLLTGIYMRHEGNPLRMDFFNLVFPLIKNLSIKLPNDYWKGKSLFDVVFHYVEVWFGEHRKFPAGKHKILGQTINFTLI
jgi:uncharacterized protein (DUF3820 family)|tara:strand:+ start:112 stop:630 length:519 start_codon:yes stop_codon:yes gene_type:complete